MFKKILTPLLDVFMSPGLRKEYENMQQIAFGLTKRGTIGVFTCVYVLPEYKTRYYQKLHKQVRAWSMDFINEHLVKTLPDQTTGRLCDVLSGKMSTWINPFYREAKRQKVTNLSPEEYFTVIRRAWMFYLMNCIAKKLGSSVRHPVDLSGVWGERGHNQGVAILRYLKNTKPFTYTHAPKVMEERIGTLDEGLCLNLMREFIDLLPRSVYPYETKVRAKEHQIRFISYLAQGAEELFPRPHDELMQVLLKQYRAFLKQRAFEMLNPETREEVFKEFRN